MCNTECFVEYCTGCGLCHAVKKVPMTVTERGFLIPESVREEAAAFMSKICMASGTYWNSMKEFKVWGEVLEPPFYAYTNDIGLRKKASGGVRI